MLALSERGSLKPHNLVSQTLNLHLQGVLRRFAEDTQTISFSDSLTQRNEKIEVNLDSKNLRKSESDWRGVTSKSETQTWTLAMYLDSSYRPRLEYKTRLCTALLSNTELFLWWQALVSKVRSAECIGGSVWCEPCSVKSVEQNSSVEKETSNLYRSSIHLGDRKILQVIWTWIINF